MNWFKNRKRKRKLSSLRILRMITEQKAEEHGFCDQWIEAAIMEASGSLIDEGMLPAIREFRESEEFDHDGTGNKNFNKFVIKLITEG